jgi:hypothetical protein
MPLTDTEAANMHVVIVTFTEGSDCPIPTCGCDPAETDGIPDVEVYGPFPDGGTANAWLDRFEEWFTSLDGNRRFSHALITVMDLPVLDLPVI